MTNPGDNARLQLPSESGHGAAARSITQLAARCFKTRRSVAYTFVVALGLFVLLHVPHGGLMDLAVNSSEDFTATPLSPDGTTANGSGPLPGWKVRSACRSTLRFLFYVHTAPDHADMRRLLRDTLGDPGIVKFLNSSLVFFIEQPDDGNLSSVLQEEAKSGGDVVQLGFLDTNRNLTHKFIRATKWLRANGCLNSTELVVKIDDDVIVNVFQLKSYISTLWAGHSPPSASLYCCRNSTLEPQRQQYDRSYRSLEEDYVDSYPPYCDGLGFFMRASVLTLLGEMAERVPLFWLDDVYVTGIVRLAANIALVDVLFACHYVGSNETVVSNETIFVRMGGRNVLSTTGRLIWKSFVRPTKASKT